jgi:hypothetical protein
MESIDNKITSKSVSNQSTIDEITNLAKKTSSSISTDISSIENNSIKNIANNNMPNLNNISIKSSDQKSTSDPNPTSDQKSTSVQESISVQEPTNEQKSTNEKSCKYVQAENIKKVDCENNYSKECNNILNEKENAERKCLEENENKNNFLYPNLNDKDFNIKIASKREFSETKYDGTLHKDIQAYADELANLDFELSPHQSFVKNFLSSQTPYNSLLLYHGLGSGKTCSAIGVCEEMRDYMKQTNVGKRIIIVASENVQDNFKLQIFDERKLTLKDGLWNINSCIGNKLIKEVNPTNIKSISKEKIISQIKNLINSYYLFLGYGQFANYIIKTMNSDTIINENSNLNPKIIKRLNNEFSDRLIVIDEVHNIRKSDDNENKKVATNLEILIKYTDNLRFLYLSATPMFNNYKEIIWLINLMNINDRRSMVLFSNIFDKEDKFKDKGRELLIQKITGYVSFVRGENPYTFPYRIYPDEFSIENTFNNITYPSKQMNLKPILDKDKISVINLFVLKLNKCFDCGGCQCCIYKYVINYLRNKEIVRTFKKGKNIGKQIKMPDFDNMESFGYTILQNPLRSLIISYPIDNLKEEIKKINENNINNDSNDSNEFFNIDPNELTGKNGLARLMNFKESINPPEKTNYEYKHSTKEKYGNIFNYENIGKYSVKIKNVLDNIYNRKTDKVSDGIILIYSQYIDGGLIPMALALEEMGFIRYGEKTKSLFKKKPVETVDVKTMKPSSNKDFMAARYSLITGDKKLSPDNDYEVKGLTDKNNINGEKVKIVLISKAGTEGIDFSNIRQVHILDPWYTMSRIEQIIGRAVRNFSHKNLIFEKRNVQIFIYGTVIEGTDEETADLYVYRVAEKKAIQIGKISRLLKETAVDCLLNHAQTNFTKEKINSMLDKPITQVLSTGVTLDDYKIGDKPFTSICDYQSTCDYKCSPNKNIPITEESYTEYFISTNNDKITQKIKLLFKEKFFYKKEYLFSAIQSNRKYPYSQIYFSLSNLIDENEIILDKYGRTGKLINIEEYYIFQPSELLNKNSSIFERSVPIDYKHSMINFDLKESVITNNPANNIVNLPIINNYESNILKEIQQNFNLTEEYLIKSKVERSDDNWFKHCGIAMQKLQIDYPNMTEYLKSYLISHIIEQLFFDEKVEILNIVFNKGNIERNSFLWYIKDYFYSKIISTANYSVLILYNLNKIQIMILNDKNIWEESDPETQREIAKDKNTKKYLSFNVSDYNKYVGFIGYKRNNSALVFKTKDMDSSRDTGATCEESGKDKSIKKLNLIIGFEKYNKENTRLHKKDGVVITESITQVELCILQEFILRYFNKISHNDKKWFLTPEMAIYHKLYKIFT